MNSTVTFQKMRFFLRNKYLKSKITVKEVESKTPKIPWPEDFYKRGLSTPSENNSDIEDYSKLLIGNNQNYILSWLIKNTRIEKYLKEFIDVSILPGKGVGSYLRIPEMGKTLSIKDLEKIFMKICKFSSSFSNTKERKMSDIHNSFEYNNRNKQIRIGLRFLLSIFSDIYLSKFNTTNILGPIFCGSINMRVNRLDLKYVNNILETKLKQGIKTDFGYTRKEIEIMNEYDQLRLLNMQANSKFYS